MHKGSSFGSGKKIEPQGHEGGKLQPTMTPNPNSGGERPLCTTYGKNNCMECAQRTNM